MRLTTIWTLQAMTFRERLRRTREWAAMQIAARLPVRIRYWVTLQMIGKATMTSPNVPATACDEILRNLEKPRSIA